MHDEFSEDFLNEERPPSSTAAVHYLVSVHSFFSFSVSGSLFYTGSNYNCIEITANLEARAFHFNYFSVLGSGTVLQAVRMIINTI